MNIYVVRQATARAGELGKDTGWNADSSNQL